MKMGQMGMEHAENSLGVPPLVNDRVLFHFCRAVEASADAAGLRDDAKHALRALRARLDDLRGLARMCRFAIVGMPNAFDRVRDQLACLAADFPGETHTSLATPKHVLGSAGSDPHLAAALDMFAGAAFVSKDDDGQRDRFVAAIVRATEAAIAFPLSYALEAATYIGEGTGELPGPYASTTIANATRRFLEGDGSCAPSAPRATHERLTGLSHDWMHSNPVTTMFAVIAGPKVIDIVRKSGAPTHARVGERVTLTIEETGGRHAELGVMFCGHEPARVTGTTKDSLHVHVPERARTGPIAIVQQSPTFAPLVAVHDHYMKRYPAEWAASIFGMVPMNLWAFPYAFAGPHLEIANPITRVEVRAFTRAGRLHHGDKVSIGEKVAIHYRVFPPGSAGDAAPKIHAPHGEISRGARSDVVFYRPTRAGDVQLELEWSSAKASVEIVAKEAP